MQSPHLSDVESTSAAPLPSLLATAPETSSPPIQDRRAGSSPSIPTSPPGSAPAVVSIDGVTKRFGEVDALSSLSLAVPEGRITVLLGPNGAGKTTAIRLITGALVPDEGSVSVFGVDPGGPGGEDVRMRCGVVSAKPSLYDRLSGMDNLRYAAELYGLGRGSNVDARVVEAADQFGIAADLEQRVGGYSTGMKTRLALARAVLHRPTLMLLDEPTSGLDPESAVAVLAMVRDMTAEGKTVLM
ncbi:MAG: ABC transporter ATP-binding protein, partial [Acidimicrobiia bacterium]|nr:ABC transporter ATP-binding protein [Acidimicrobiia bacterium]